MRRLAGTISRAVTRLEEACLAGGILGIAALTIGNVLARSLAGTSLFFAEEVSQFLIVLVTFLGLGYAAGQGRHVRMTALADALPPRWRKGVRLVVTSTTALLLAFFAVLAARYALGTVRALGSVSPVLRVPLWIVYLAAPLGLTLAAVQYLLAFVRNVTTPGVHLSFTVPDEYTVPDESTVSDVAGDDRGDHRSEES